MENGGIYVAKARHLSLAGSTSNGPSNFIPMSPRVAQSPQRNGAQNGGKSPWQVHMSHDMTDLYYIIANSLLILEPFCKSFLVHRVNLAPEVIF